MALDPVNVGAAPGDGTGDGLRTAFGKVNANDAFLEGVAAAAQGDASQALADAAAADGKAVAAQGDATQALADAAAAQGTADAAIPASEKGAAAGVATLDADGLPVQQALGRFRLWRVGNYYPFDSGAAPATVSLRREGWVHFRRGHAPPGSRVDRVSISIKTARPNAEVRLGVYADADDWPGALLADFGTLDATTTGIKEIVLGSALDLPERYWVAACTQGEPTEPVGVHGWLSPVMGLQGGSRNAWMDPGAGNDLRTSAAYTSGGLPNPAGSVIQGVEPFPMVRWRAA